jgi:hypothetical protein
MRVSKPSLGKYLRRAAATRSWKLELEVTRTRAEAHLQIRAPKIGALSRRSWGKGAANLRPLLPRASSATS